MAHMIPKLNFRFDVFLYQIFEIRAHTKEDKLSSEKAIAKTELPFLKRTNL